MLPVDGNQGLEAHTNLGVGCTISPAGTGGKRVHEARVRSSNAASPHWFITTTPWPIPIPLARPPRTGAAGSSAHRPDVGSNAAPSLNLFEVSAVAADVLDPPHTTNLSPDHTTAGILLTVMGAPIVPQRGTRGDVTLALVCAGTSSATLVVVAGTMPVTVTVDTEGSTRRVPEQDIAAATTSDHPARQVRVRSFPTVMTACPVGAARCNYDKRFSRLSQRQDPSSCLRMAIRGNTSIPARRSDATRAVSSGPQRASGSSTKPSRR